MPYRRASVGANLAASPCLMLATTTEKEVVRFIDDKVAPALDKVAAELQSRGRPTEVEREAPGLVTLRCPARTFVTSSTIVSVQKHRVASFTTPSSRKGGVPL